MNVNFVGKFGISNVVDVVLKLKFGAKNFGIFGQIQRVIFWVLVSLVKMVLKCFLEPLSTLGH